MNYVIFILWRPKTFLSCLSMLHLTNTNREYKWIAFDTFGSIQLKDEQFVLSKESPQNTWGYFVRNLRVFHLCKMQIEGILPKGPYPPCLCMADRALLAGYPRNAHPCSNFIGGLIPSPLNIGRGCAITSQLFGCNYLSMDCPQCWLGGSTEISQT